MAKQFETIFYTVGNAETNEFVDIDFGTGYPYKAKHMGKRATDMNYVIKNLLPDAKLSYCNIPDVKVYRIILEEVDNKIIAEHQLQQNKMDELIEGLSPEQIKYLKSKL